MDNNTPAPIEQASRTLSLQKTDLLTHVNWEPTGKSPGNTPQAKLQAAQMFLQMLANPSIAQYINLPALLTIILKDGPLQNATNVLKSQQEVQQMAQQQQQAQMAQMQAQQGPPNDQSQPTTAPAIDSGAVPGPPASQGVPDGTGMGSMSGVPNAPPINSGIPMPGSGPDFPGVIHR